MLVPYSRYVAMYSVVRTKKRAPSPCEAVNSGMDFQRNLPPTKKPSCERVSAKKPFKNI